MTKGRVEFSEFWHNCMILVDFCFHRSQINFSFHFLNKDSIIFLQEIVVV